MSTTVQKYPEIEAGAHTPMKFCMFGKIFKMTCVYNRFGHKYVQTINLITYFFIGFHLLQHREQSE